jgi:hypothetical protein
LKVLQRFEYAFSTESVQCPEKNRIKLAAGCSGEHLLKLVSVGTLPGRTVFVFPLDAPVLLSAEFPQLAQLVLRVLFVSAADAGVDGNLHKTNRMRWSEDA